MSKNFSRLAILFACLFLTLELQAQGTIVIPKREKLEIRGSNGDFGSIVQEIQRQGPFLNLNRGQLERLNKKEIPASLVYTVKQQSKVVHKSEKVALVIQPKMERLDLAKNGLDESMIATWEKQGFIRRQVGRIEDPDAKTGSLPSPQAPGSGTAGATPKDRVDSKPLSSPGKKLEQQGFIRRQVGRIPKGDYEVEVRLMTPQDRGNSQPTVFLVKIL